MHLHRTIFFRFQIWLVCDFRGVESICSLEEFLKKMVRRLAPGNFQWMPFVSVRVSNYLYSAVPPGTNSSHFHGKTLLCWPLFVLPSSPHIIVIFTATRSSIFSISLVLVLLSSPVLSSSALRVSLFSLAYLSLSYRWDDLRPFRPHSNQYHLPVPLFV